MICYKFVPTMEERGTEKTDFYMLTEGQIQCMKEDMTSALAQILIEEQNYSMEQALSAVYNSTTFRNLQNTATGLYYQSVGYVYDDLQRELKLSTTPSNPRVS